MMNYARRKANRATNSGFKSHQSCLGGCRALGALQCQPLRVQNLCSMSSHLQGLPCTGLMCLRGPSSLTCTAVHSESRQVCNKRGREMSGMHDKVVPHCQCRVTYLVLQGTETSCHDSLASLPVRRHHSSQHSSGPRLRFMMRRIMR